MSLPKQPLARPLPHSGGDTAVSNHALPYPILSTAIPSPSAVPTSPQAPFSNVGTPSTAIVPLSPDEPHLVSLVLQSKKALQHGEHLCTRAHSASNASAQAAVDVLSLDARVRWVVEAVSQQLKLAATVAKTIEEKRADIDKRVADWDKARVKHTDALDSILESLGSQVVPPGFHQTSAESSLFGSQHSEDTRKRNSFNMEPFQTSPKNGSAHMGGIHGRVSSSPDSPSATLRRNSSLKKYAPARFGSKELLVKKDKQEDRRTWKTLRDFVDDRAIDDALEMVESDSNALEEFLGKTDDYPHSLFRTINSIELSLPTPDPGDPGALSRVQEIIIAQDNTVASMAGVLENLVNHYDGMASALKDTENGEAFTDEELETMKRDTEELPAIMAEMERDMNTVESHHEQLMTTKRDLENDLTHLRRVLGKLDELGEIIGEMLETQDEARAEEDLNGLHQHLSTLSHLHGQFVSYRTAFDKLLLEIARRRQYTEAAESKVRGMREQLEAMAIEEARLRADFNEEYGRFMPEDLCLCIGNTPTRWEVAPWDSSVPEVLPTIDADLIAQASYRVGPMSRPFAIDNL